MHKGDRSGAGGGGGGMSKDNRYPVPDGFRQLLEALAREVLRGQPDDIYAFSALFFKVLLDMRHELNGENPIQRPELYDKFKRRLFAAAAQENLVSPSMLSAFPANAGKTSGQRTKETTAAAAAGGSAEDVDIDLTDPQLNKAATKIQATYRGFQTRHQLDKEAAPLRRNHHGGGGGDENRAATKIQANIRGYLTRKHYKEGTLKPAPRPPKQQHKKPKRPTTLEDEAASKIQAGVRGFLTRKELESRGIRVKSPTSQHSPRSPIQDDHTPTSTPMSPGGGVNPDLAASKIQAGVRGYLTRKQLAARGVPVHSPTHNKSPHKAAGHEETGEDEAASKIQAGVRGYLTRKHLEQEGLRKSPARNAAMDTRRVTIANVDEAATKIQAGIRGYLTRKHLESQGIHVHSGGVSPSSSASPLGPGGGLPGGGVGVGGGHPPQYNHVGDDGIGSPGDAEEAAATKIQAAFRGHMVRQQLNDKDENKTGEYV